MENTIDICIGDKMVRKNKIKIVSVWMVVFCLLSITYWQIWLIPEAKPRENISVSNFEQSELVNILYYDDNTDINIDYIKYPCTFYEEQPFEISCGITNSNIARRNISCYLAIYDNDGGSFESGGANKIIADSTINLLADNNSHPILLQAKIDSTLFSSQVLNFNIDYGDNIFVLSVIENDTQSICEQISFNMTIKSITVPHNISIVAYISSVTFGILVSIFIVKYKAKD